MLTEFLVAQLAVAVEVSLLEESCGLLLGAPAAGLHQLGKLVPVQVAIGVSLTLLESVLDLLGRVGAVL